MLPESINSSRTESVTSISKVLESLDTEANFSSTPPIGGQSMIPQSLDLSGLAEAIFSQGKAGLEKPDFTASPGVSTPASKVAQQAIAMANGMEEAVEISAASTEPPKPEIKQASNPSRFKVMLSAAGGDVLANVKMLYGIPTSMIIGFGEAVKDAVSLKTTPKDRMEAVLDVALMGVGIPLFLVAYVPMTATLGPVYVGGSALLKAGMALNGNTSLAKKYDDEPGQGNRSKGNLYF